MTSGLAQWHARSGNWDFTENQDLEPPTPAGAMGARCPDNEDGTTISDEDDGKAEWPVGPGVNSGLVGIFPQG